MKGRLLGMTVVVLAGLMMTSPAGVVAQSGSIQARARVVAAVEIPTVRVVGEGIGEAERSVVRVTGARNWGVRVHLAGEELALSGGRGAGRGVEVPRGPARAPVPGGAWESGGGARDVIQVVLALN